MSTVEKISEALQAGRVKEVLALIDIGLDEGISAQQMLEEGMLKGMALLGVRFKNNEVFVPEVLMSARALNKGSAKLKPYLTDGDSAARGVAVIGTVEGDLHDIGKNLVKMMLEGAGFEVHDLGIDVPDQKFVESITEHQPDLLCLSALLTTTMDQQRSVIEAVSAAGLRDQVKILVGGAPITAEFASEIGADGYAPDAASTADLASTLVP